MIYVTHDQVEAMTMGDRICIMNGGKVVQIGAPLDVYRDPADTFVASFLDTQPQGVSNTVTAVTTFDGRCDEPGRRRQRPTDRQQAAHAVDALDG